jgi:hypothetical protein
VIISKLFCGLGNQMFQYAAGLALAHRRNTVLKVDVSWFSEGSAEASHERYGLDCFVLDAHFATAQELAWNQGRQRNSVESRLGYLLSKIGLRRYAELLPTGGNWHIQKQFHFYPDFFDLPDATMIDGTFQSEQFFAPVAAQLRRAFHFRYPATREVEALAEMIRSGPSVAVHFRRGDYLKHKGYSRGIGAVGYEYYDNAIHMLKSRLPAETKYFIFSDEIEAVEREYKPSVPATFVNMFQGGNFFDKIRLMSICQHNIIANSTFSWWSAWLNSNSEKIVIHPIPWFANMPEKDTRDLFPEGWIAINR